MMDSTLPFNDGITDTYRSPRALGEASLDHSLDHVLHDLLIRLLLGLHQNSLALLW
jgi:hypothetical protein